MTRYFALSLLALLALALAGCSAAVTPAVSPEPADSGAQAPAPPEPADARLARTDSQASVEFVVTPLNLDAPGETLDFDVSLNTHAVDLSWNLAARSVLSTDTGLEVKGQSWPVGSGHHYAGTLAFPAKTAEGQMLLDGAQTLTLVIRDTGVAERVFVWELP